MKIKKLSTVFLCAAVCTAILTGCGERKETSLSGIPDENGSTSSALSESSAISESSSYISSNDPAFSSASGGSSIGSSVGSSNSTYNTSGSDDTNPVVPSSTTASQSTSTPQSVPQQTTSESTSSVHQHQYSLTKSTEPTCLEIGYEVYKCSCGDQYTKNTADALGHSYSKTTVAPTCTNNGYTTYTCSRCGQSHKDDITSATGHKYTSKTVKATCTQNGYTLHTCSNCGNEYTSDSTSALNHTWGEWTITKNATTTYEGEKRSECTRCGETRTESIDKLKADSSSYASEVVRLVNIERGKYGLSPLTARNDLTEYAQLRSKEIVSNFEHVRPDGSNPLQYVMGLGGIHYSGENIAYGQRTPEEVVKAWMNSEGHRKNILSSNFTSIGVGCYQNNGTFYWTQIFAG